MKRETLRKILKFLFTHLAHVDYQGLENLPPTGGVLITTNHVSRLDTPLLFVNAVRPDITALVTDKYLAYPLIKWFTNTAEGIWLDRTKADFSAFAAAFKVLKDGRALGIAPEGTRSHTGSLLEGKSGSLLLATKGDVPIVPVAVIGSQYILPQLKRLRRPKVIVRFGPAYKLPPIDRDDREASMQRLTDELMCRIAVLLPEEMHGFYAGHPRIAELRQELNLG